MAKTTTQPKPATLDEAISDIHKTFGEGSIMRLGDAKQLDVEVIPTGSLALDIALGAGGVPKGRVVEIFGPESSGKKIGRASCRERVGSEVGARYLKPTTKKIVKK